MKRIPSYLLTFASLLATVGAQSGDARFVELAAPLPESWTDALTLSPAPATIQDPPADPDAVTWKSNVNLGGTYTSGNTETRAASFAFDTERSAGRQKTMVKANWNYAEAKSYQGSVANPPRRLVWELDQRRTAGTAKHNLYLSDEKKAYWFGELSGENNFKQSIDLRASATVGIGAPVVQNDEIKFALEVGAGFFLEQPSTPTDPTARTSDSDFWTGRAGWDFNWQVKKGIEVINSLKYFFSLEDENEMYGESDTKVRATISEGMFAQVQWLIQWDNTPSFNDQSPAARNNRTDHTVLLTVGWSF